ncbi:hypothetical protein K0O13_07725 [Mammaliicoccus sciuri]|uniref:hypothetical protein n=1 Tax=Mammaliicoccus sciuri TaxID=1296 RepID=UPI001C635FCE|nr:hypothetical protein [Mammaliicoccus sciuri]QYG29989.1 hypothetical protein K0O13_07725 [Mammaliicoccus sciuri]
MSKNQKDNLLNLEEIKKLAEQYEDTEIHTLKTVNQDIKFNPYFSRTKIAEIMEEFQKYMKSEDEADKKYMEHVTETEQNTILFWHFLAIKKFTSIGDELNRKRKVKSLFPYYKALLETGILEEIINDVFSFTELQKLHTMFATQAGTMSAAEDFMSKYDEVLEQKREDFKEHLNTKVK